MMAEKTGMPDFSRGTFYRNGLRRLLWVNFLLLMVTTGLVIYAVYCHQQMPPAAFYATTTGGELIRLTPAEHPQAATTAHRVLPEEI